MGVRREFHVPHFPVEVENMEYFSAREVRVLYIIVILPLVPGGLGSHVLHLPRPNEAQYST